MKTRFIIFSQSRSGSTLLKELLNSHPVIKCEGEILAMTDGYIRNTIQLRILRRFPIPYIYYLKTLARSDVFGFTLFSYHISYPQFYLPFLNKHGWKIIYLNRRSVLNQILSSITAEKRNYFHNRDPEKSTQIEELKISKEEFLKNAKLRLQRHRREEKILKKCSYLSISYEDELENEKDWNTTAKKIFDYLNLEFEEVSSNLKKTYTVPYSQLIENYEELEREFLNLNRKEKFKSGTISRSFG